VLNVNELAKGHAFMSVAAYNVSDDGNLLAYTTDDTGFRQYTLAVKICGLESSSPIMRKSWSGGMGKRQQDNFLHRGRRHHQA